MMVMQKQKRKTSSEMICGKCHQPAKQLHGSLGGNYMECEKCYIPIEKKQDFEYIPTGQTSGYIKIPEEMCGVCGHHIIQPTPLGLWTHGRDAEDDGGSDVNDHIPRVATQLELLIRENKREDSIQPIGHWHYYRGDSNAVHKDRFVQCLIHRKYWMKEANLKDDARLARWTNGYTRTLKEAVENFIYWSERANAKQFKEFLINNRLKKLKENPKA